MEHPYDNIILAGERERVWAYDRHSLFTFAEPERGQGALMQLKITPVIGYLIGFIVGDSLTIAQGNESLDRDFVMVGQIGEA